MDELNGPTFWNQQNKEEEPVKVHLSQFNLLTITNDHKRAAIKPVDKTQKDGHSNWYQ